MGYNVLMNKLKLTIVALISATLVGCAFPQPVPQWSVESCLRAHGTPVYTSDSFNTNFHCVINDGRNSLNARYFNDSSLIENPPPPPPPEGG